MTPAGYRHRTAPGERAGRFLLDDHAGQGIGEHAFQAITHLDAHLAVVGRHDQQHPIVEFLAADSPVAAQLVAIIGDVIALQIRHGDHHHLVGGVLLGRDQRLGQALTLGRSEQVGLVHHPAGEFREIPAPPKGATPAAA